MEMLLDFWAIIVDWKREERRYGVAFLTKATSLKWELDKSIRSGHLTSPKRRREYEQWMRQNAIVQTSPVNVQGILIQYSRFHWETASVCGPGLSDLTLAALRQRRNGSVLEANSPPSIPHFTCATSILDTTNVYIDGASIEGIKNRNRWNNAYTISVRL